MQSELDIVNDALSLLGKDAVSSADELPISLYLQRKINRLHPLLLKRENWIFAAVEKYDNTPVSPNLSDDYTYTYQLPTNFGRFFRWSKTVRQDENYQFVDGYLLTNSKPVSYWYIVNDADFSIVGDLYAEALAHYAASESCLVLTNSKELTVYLKNQFKEALNNAIKFNNTQKPIVSAPYNGYQRTQFV